MILAVDSSALILLINPDSDPPEDPATGKPLTFTRERIELFLTGLSATDTLIVPTPVLAEVLVSAEGGGPGLLEAISGMARMKVRPFGERAAIETAMMTREALTVGDKRGGSKAPWQKVKVDRQVVAVARAEGATSIYADDHDLVDFARRLGMDVFSTWDLPAPEVLENLFTVAGVSLEPQTDRASESAELEDVQSAEVETEQDHQAYQDAVPERTRRLIDVSESTSCVEPEQLAPLIVDAILQELEDDAGDLARTDGRSAPDDREVGGR